MAVEQAAWLMLAPVPYSILIRWKVDIRKKAELCPFVGY